MVAAMQVSRALKTVGALGLSSVCLIGCGTTTPALTPRLQDASAPRDYYRALHPSGSKCKRQVPVLRAEEVGGRAYHEISRLSASCYPGAPEACKQTLTNRACELEADALILIESSPGGSPPGASGQSSVSISARAVRWTPVE